MRSASTSRFQVTGDQRPSQFDQSSTSRTARAAADGSPQSRRSRSQPKPFSASTHRAGAPARRHGGSSDSGATAPALPRASSSPMIRRWPIAGSPGQLSGATAKKERGEA